MRFVITFVLFPMIFILTGCPEKEPAPQKKDNRKPLANDIWINLEKDRPGTINCGKGFEIKGVPFLVENKSGNTSTYYDPNNKYDLRIGWGYELTIDLSKYNNIRSLDIQVRHINAFGGHDASVVILYDLNDKIITEKMTSSDYQSAISFKEDLSNIKSVVVKGWAEVTDIKQLYVRK